MKNRKIVSGIFMAMFIALFCHLVWCLNVHKDIDTTTTKINGSQVDLTMEEVLSENKRLNEKVEQLEAQLKEGTTSSVNDGQCHNQCPVHCPCEHDNVKTEEGDWTWKGTKSSDVCQTGTRVVKTICTDCGQTVKEVTETRQDKEHNYVNGICQDCGYTKATSTPTTPKPSTTVQCKHGTTKKVTSDWTMTNIKTDDGCQKATRTVKTVCSTCSKVLKRETEEKINATHTFKDGTCTVCGYGCKHPKTEDKYGKWSTPENVGTEVACYKRTRSVETTCCKCSKVVKTFTDIEYVVEHSFKNDKCITCGYSKACDHAKTKVETGKWSWDEVSTESCCLYGTRVVKTICTKCDKVIDKKTETKYDNIHNFTDGKCEDCGFAIEEDTSCKHTSTKKETGKWDWNNVCTESCCMHGTRTVKTVCTKCGEVVKTETEKKYDYDHDFNGRTCTDCGFKKPLSEGYGEATGEVPPPTNSWTAEDDGELPTPIN